MNILFIVTRTPNHLGQADQRTTARAIEFLRDHMIDVDVCLLKPMRFYHIWGLINAAYMAIVHKMPLQVSIYNTRLNRITLNKYVHNGKKYDRIYCHLIRSMVADAIVPHSQIHLGMQISQGLNFKRIATETNWGIKKLLYFYEAYLCSYYERRIVEKVAATNFTGSQDTEFLAPLNQNKYSIIPHGIDMSFEPSSQKLGDLVFLAHFKSDANVSAFLFLVTKVMPIILKARPHTTLSVYGMNIPRSFHKYSNKNIRIYGEVKNPISTISSFKIMLNPVKAAAGMQNKVLNGLCAGVPVVTTKVAVRGMKLPYTTCIETDDDEASFARAVLTTLDHYPSGAELIKTQEDINENWSWSTLHYRWAEEFLKINTSKKLNIDND